MWSGSTPWVLAVGEISWLTAAFVALAGFLWARHLLPTPRPGFWSMRFMLIHDTVRARSSPSGPDGSSLGGCVRRAEVSRLVGQTGMGRYRAVRRVPHIGLKAPSGTSEKWLGRSGGVSLRTRAPTCVETGQFKPATDH